MKGDSEPSEVDGFTILLIWKDLLSLYNWARWTKVINRKGPL